MSRALFKVNEIVMAFPAGEPVVPRTKVLQSMYIEDHPFDNDPKLYTGWIYRTDDCTMYEAYIEAHLRKLPPPSTKSFKEIKEEANKDLVGAC